MKEKGVIMRKVLTVCMCGLMAATLMAGCSKKDSATENSATEDSVELGTYKGVEYTPAAVEVTDEDVEAEIQYLLDSNPVFTEVSRAAKEGDTVNIDYVGLKEGVAFDGGTANGYDLTLGSGSFIDGFEDGLIGAVTGQELSLNLTFPKEYPSEELAGQAVVFDVTVNAVKESSPAQLTDEFIKEKTDAKTVDQYREETRTELLEQAQSNAENQKKSDVFKKVMDGSKITITDATIEANYQEQLSNYEKEAEAAGIDLETMVTFYGMDLETFKAQLKEMAGEAAKQNLVVNAIAAQEGLAVTEEEKDALAEEFGYESAANMIELVGENTVNNYILTEKVVTFIADHAVEV